MNGNTSDTLSPVAGRVYGWAAIVGPVLLLASTIAFITDGEGINDGVIGGTIGVWSCLALAVAFVGVLRQLEPRAPRAAPILTMLALTGMAAGVGFNVQAMYLANYELDFLAEATEGGSVEGSAAIGILAFLPWGWLVPVSFVLVGIFLWRTRTASMWTGALLVLSGVLFVTARPARIDFLALVGDGALILALAPIGWAMLSGTRATAAAAPVEPVHT